MSHGVPKKLKTGRHSEDLRNHLGRQGEIVWILWWDVKSLESRVLAAEYRRLS